MVAIVEVTIALNIVHALDVIAFNNVVVASDVVVAFDVVNVVTLDVVVVVALVVVVFVVRDGVNTERTIIQPPVVSTSSPFAVCRLPFAVPLFLGANEKWDNF